MPYLLKPQYGENDVGEVGDLLDVDDLRHGQVDLDTGARAYRRAHLLRGQMNKGCYIDTKNRA